MKMILLGMITILPSLAFAQCKSLEEKEFDKKLSPSIKRIVFFASWCKSCEVHLTEDYAKDSLFVASFDQKDKADQVFAQKLGRSSSALCIWDNDNVLAKKYGVKFLPFVKTL